MMQNLPDVALSAWNAYRAMEQSKGEYFAYLTELERKYEHGGSRSNSEKHRLEGLLDQHDKQVAGFRQAMRTLKAQDASAHQALIEHITLLNAEIGSTDGVRRNSPYKAS